MEEYFFFFESVDILGVIFMSVVTHGFESIKRGRISSVLKILRAERSNIV